MTEWLMYLLAIFAAYRIARITATEEGPGGVFEQIRSRIDPLQATWLGRGVNCALCEGVWISFLLALLLPVHSWQEYILSGFGIAGAQTLLHLQAEQ